MCPIRCACESILLYYLLGVGSGSRYLAVCSHSNILISTTAASFQAPLVAPDNVLTGVYARTCRGGQKKIEFVGEEQIRSRQQVPSLNRCARL